MWTKIKLFEKGNIEIRMIFLWTSLTQTQIKSVITGYISVFKFLRRRVDEKHLMRFQSEASVFNFFGVKGTGPRVSVSSWAVSDAFMPSLFFVLRRQMKKWCYWLITLGAHCLCDQIFISRKYLWSVGSSSRQKGYWVPTPTQASLPFCAGVMSSCWRPVLSRFPPRV